MTPETQPPSFLAACRLEGIFTVKPSSQAGFLNPLSSSVTTPRPNGMPLS